MGKHRCHGMRMINAQGHVMESRYGSPAERLLLQRWIRMQGPYMGCANGKRASAVPLIVVLES